MEYDATRLNAAAVTRLIRLTGLEIAEELPLIAAPRDTGTRCVTVDCAGVETLIICVWFRMESPCAPVAQLDRATDYESVGREFESLRAHHLNLTF